MEENLKSESETLMMPSLQEREFEPKTQSCKDEMSSLLTHESKQLQKLISDHPAQDEPCCLHIKNMTDACFDCTTRFKF